MITRATLSTIEQGLPKYRSMLAGNSAYVPSGFYSIASVVASGGESLITINSIPTIYDHLHLRVTGNITAAFANNNNLLIKRFNGDTAANYMWRAIESNASTVTTSKTNSTSYLGGFGDMFPSTNQTNYVGSAMADIYDYAKTNKHKTVISYGANHGGSSWQQTRHYIASWSNTAAITSISFEPQYTFAAGTRIAIYGVL